MDGKGGKRMVGEGGGQGSKCGQVSQAGMCGEEIRGESGIGMGTKGDNF